MLRFLDRTRVRVAALLAVGAVVLGDAAIANNDGRDPSATAVFARELGLRGRKEKPAAVGLTPWSRGSGVGGTQIGSTNQTLSPLAISPWIRVAQTGEDELPPVGEGPTSSDLDLDPDILQNSPVLQDWLQNPPDIADEIRNKPSFRTRLRVGYAQFPSSGEASGIHVEVEDVFLIAGTGLTVSGDFSRSWNNARESFGAEARYYLLPLGGYVNLAPTVGYRSLETLDYTSNGLDLGLRLMIIPSRGGGADIAVGQHWVAPGADREVGMTSISVGYAVTPNLRIGTDVEFQNSSSGQDSRIGLLLEWLM